MKPRNYAKEYAEYHSRPDQIKRRSARNKARRMMAKKHGIDAIRNKDINHKDQNPTNNSATNLSIEDPSVNRARKRKRRLL